MTRPATRAIPIVLLAVLIDSIGFGIVMPVLPELVTSLGHMTLAQATIVSGWLLAVFAIAQFFAGPVIGNLADSYGRRPVLIASMLAFGADYALMAWAPTLAWLFVGRAIAGAAGASIGPAGAVIADTTAPDDRAKIFGYLGAAFGIGFMLGPALGGITATWGPRTPFLIAAGCAAINALLMLVALPETLAPANRRPFRLREAHILGSFRPLFHAGDAAPILVAWFLWQLGCIVYPATWAFWGAIRFGWGPAEIGWSLAWVGALSVVVQVGLTGLAVAWMGERRAAIVGLASTGFALFACAFATASWQVYAAFAIGALGSFDYPALSGLITRMVDDTRQGALQGGIAAMNAVAAIFGPLIAAQSLGFGVRHGFDGAAFLVAGTLVIVAMAIVGRTRVQTA